MKNSSKGFLGKNSVLVFFFLVFIISWGAIYLLAGPGGFPITEDQAMVMGMAILLGPTLASLILTASAGRTELKNLLSRLVKWRVRGKWYAIALLMAPVTTILTLVVLSFFSTQFKASILSAPDKGGLLIGALIAGLVVGLFEELGWTGFAVPRLLKTKSVLYTGILVGLVWGAWHFPLFWQMNSFTASLPFALLVARLFSWLPPYRTLLVWVYKNTSSLLLAILMHASLVASLMALDPVVEGLNLVIFILVRAGFLWLIIAILGRSGRLKA